MDLDGAALLCITKMRKYGRLHRQFSYRCRHPNGVALNERAEVEFQIDMPTYGAAREIGIRILAARQKVQLLQPIHERDCIWRVAIRPVMVPRPENIAGYREMLTTEAAHFGGSVVHTTTLQPMPGYCGTMWRPSLTFEFANLAAASPLLIDWLFRGESLYVTTGLRRMWWVCIEHPRGTTAAQRQLFKQKMIAAAESFGGLWVVSTPDTQ